MPFDRVLSWNAISHPQVAIKVDDAGRIAHIALSGELDVAVVPDVRDMVKLLVTREGLTELHMDVTQVTFIDSAGLMILTGARRVAHEHGLVFTLVAKRVGPVARIISLCGFDRWFAETRSLAS